MQHSLASAFLLATNLKVLTMTTPISTQHQSRRVPAIMPTPASTGAVFNPSRLSSQISLQQFTLAEMPDDLLFQLFQWTMRQDELGSSVRAFGCVSSRIHQKLHGYLSTESYKELMSDLIRQRGAKFANALFDSVTDLFYLESTALKHDLKKIISMINQHTFDASGRSPQRKLKLMFGNTLMENEEYPKEFISSFKNYRSPALELSVMYNEDIELLNKIEAVLPKHVGMNVVIGTNHIEDSIDGLVRFISSARANDRMLGFESLTEFHENDKVTATILDAMCGRGLVPIVYFVVDDLVAALKHLTDHCQHFRHLQKLIIKWKDVELSDRKMAALSDKSGRDVLEGFIDALESRRENKKSEFSVIILHGEDPRLSEFFSPYMNDSKLNKGVSLYSFCELDVDRELMKSMMSFVGKGPSDPWMPKSYSSKIDGVHAAAATNSSGIHPDAVTTANDLSDSDSIIESSDDKTPYPRSFKATPISEAIVKNVRLDDDEDSITQSREEASESDSKESSKTPRSERNPPERRGSEQGQVVSNEPRLKKREKCIIS
jgi:hypothetical protein